MDGRRRGAHRTAAGVTITALLAMGLTACGGGKRGTEYAGVCVDPKTQQRVPDDRCDDDTHHHGYVGVAPYSWYYLPIGRYSPPLGARVLGGSFARPSGRLHLGGTSSSGQTITRGGFGSSAKHTSGG